jgi:MFS family permease
MDQSLFGYAIPSIMKDFGISIQTIGWILSASFIFSAISVLVIGLLADQFGRRIMYVFCLAVSALLVGLQGWAYAVTVLALLRVLAFGISAGLAPITTAYTVEAAPARVRGLLSGLLQCGYPIGWFVASVAAAPLLRHFGWRLTFAPAFLVVPAALVILKYLPESERFQQIRHVREKSPNATLVSLISRMGQLFLPDLRGQTLLCFVAFFLFGGAYAGTAFYFPKYLSDVYGYSPEKATLVIGLSYGIGTVGYIAASWIGEFYLTRRNTIVLWVWTGAAATMGVVWLAKSYGAVLVWLSLMTTFFYGVSAVLGTFVAEIFPTRVRATGIAFSGSLALNLGLALFPVLVARAVQTWSWQWAFSIAVVPALIICGLAVLGIPNVASGKELDDISQ